MIGKANKIEAKARILGSASCNIDQQCYYGNRPIENTKAYIQGAPIKDLIVKKPKSRTLTLGLFFQDSIAEEFFKTRGLKDDFSHNNQLFAQFKKVDRTFNKKSQTDKKEQHCLQRTQNLRTSTPNANVAYNAEVQKDLS